MRTALLPIKNSLRAQSRAKLLDMARVQRSNFAYNSANGFDAAALQNIAEARFYEWLATRPGCTTDGHAYTVHFCHMRDETVIAFAPKTMEGVSSVLREYAQGVSL